MSKNKKDRFSYLKRNIHHILWPKRHWKTGYAKKLRDHYYMKYLMNQWVHENLHANLTTITAPNGSICRKAYEKLCEMDKNGEISEYDKVEKRIDVLVDILKNENCSLTVGDLRQQRDVVKVLYSVRPK